jgi:broad specificity phosphatase PhoE
MWLEQRVDDPELSTIGHTEAKDFASYFAPLFKDSKTEVKVYVSPFLRTLQTSQPLCDAMGVGAIVQPDIFEIGGVYTMGGGKRSGPGVNLTAENAKSLFPT